MVADASVVTSAIAIVAMTVKAYECYGSNGSRSFCRYDSYGSRIYGFQRFESYGSRCFHCYGSNCYGSWCIRCYGNRSYGYRCFRSYSSNCYDRSPTSFRIDSFCYRSYSSWANGYIGSRCNGCVSYRSIRTSESNVCCRSYRRPTLL